MLIEKPTVLVQARGGLPESVTCGSRLTLPDAVGVPVIAPEVLIDNPAGNAEPPRLQV